MITSIITSIATTGVILGAVAFFGKTLISKLFDGALEKYKSELLLENQKELESIESASARLLEMQETANATFSAANSAGNAKVLEAIGHVWNGFLHVDHVTPPAVGLLDLFEPGQYDEMFSNATTAPVVGQMNKIEMAEVFGKTGELESHRPFVGEYMWTLFSAYRQLKGRLAIKIIHDRDDGTREHWSSDEIIRPLLQRIIDDDDQFGSIFTSETPAKDTFAIIKQKFVIFAADVVSGKTAASAGIENANQIAKHIREMNAQA